MSAPQSLIDELLAEQQLLTAVERFSQRHEDATQPILSKYYRDLIPLSKPGPGEQYAFEVDLDACSGCKACVSACHSLNGLDEGESWRDVGLLIGEESGVATQQTSTSACHHCLDPACANGCPTMAYEKDAATGIVRHLDDQCIGCRYCELKCPYEVPKFNDRLGIVRKCDMCHSRLAEGEAPACVQACPNQAIRIRVVSVEQVAATTTAETRLLPGTVTSDYTQPTTRFLNLREDAELRPADENAVHPAHGHFPLVWMLVLTQMGAGITLFDWLQRFTQPSGDLLRLMTGVAFAFAGLAGSVLHLGRPLQAWRAFLGWKTSWLSREILVFGAWSGALVAYFGAAALSFPAWMIAILGAGASAAGLLGVFTSVMVYADTRRPYWELPWTALRFYGTLLGAGLILSSAPWLATLPILAVLLLDVAVLLGELPRFQKSGRIMREHLRSVAVGRLALGGLALLLLSHSALAITLLLLSELAGRYLFFRAVDEPKMPGGIRP